MASGSLLPTSLALTNTLTSKLSYHVLLFNANFMYKSLFNGRALFARKLKGPSCFGQNRQVIQLSCAKDGPIWDFELFVRGKSDGWIIWQKGIRRRGVIGCTIRKPKWECFAFRKQSSEGPCFLHVRIVPLPCAFIESFFSSCLLEQAFHLVFI